MKIYGGKINFGFEEEQLVLYIGGQEFAYGKRALDGSLDIEPAALKNEEGFIDALNMFDIFYDISEYEDFANEMNNEKFALMAYNTSHMLIGTVLEMLESEIEGADSMATMMVNKDHTAGDIGRMTSFAAFSSNGSQEAAPEAAAVAFEKIAKEQPEELEKVLFGNEKMVVITKINGHYSLVALRTPKQEDILGELMKSLFSDDNDDEQVLH